MDLYEQVKKQWQMWSVRSGEDLDLRLDSFRILFAYNSGKIENAEVSYHDTREIFENSRVVGYTGDPRDLPQASAIAKQIGYNHYLSRRENNTFYSIFLLPFAKEAEEKPVKYIGYAENASSLLSCADKVDKEDEKMDKVAVCLVDLKTLVDVYFNVAHKKDGTPIVKADMRRKLAEKVYSRF